MNGFDAKIPLADVPKHLCRPISENENEKYKGRVPSLQQFEEMLKYLDWNDRDKWLGAYRIGGHCFGRTDETRKILDDANTAGYSGKRAAGDDERMHEAFHGTNGGARGRPLGIGSLVRWAKEGGRVGQSSGGIANLDMAVQIIEDNPDFCNVWWDEFLQRMLTGDPPREWNDGDDLELTLRFQREKKLAKMALETVSRAVTITANANRKNKLKDWLDGLAWDGAPRIEMFFVDHFHAENSDYTRKVGQNFWLSIVARPYRPGCQVDNMVYLEGPQGIGKSQAVRAIGGEHFAEQHERITAKDFYINLRGKLLIEIGELSAFKGADIEKVKQVVTTVSDCYRDPFGRRATDHPRQCVFVATTNRSDWNHDETGARRFWPIACRGRIDVAGIVANREQLFAEAVRRFKDGESWWEMPVEATLEEQANRYTPPDWVEKIATYLSDWALHTPARTAPPTEMTVAELLEFALLKPPGQWTNWDQQQVGRALKYLGWEKKRVHKDGKRPVVWQLKEPAGEQ